MARRVGKQGIMAHMDAFTVYDHRSKTPKTPGPVQCAPIFLAAQEKNPPQNQMLLA
jgi:hypothetical protein